MGFSMGFLAFHCPAVALKWTRFGDMVQLPVHLSCSADLSGSEPSLKLSLSLSIPVRELLGAVSAWRPVPEPPKRCVRVRNLLRKAKPDEIRGAFAQVGPVSSCSVTAGTAKVTFETRRD